MAKGVQKTDFAEIGGRINGYLDFENIKSESDYKKAVTELVNANDNYNRASNILNVLDDLYEKGGAKEKIESQIADNESAYAKAVRFERRRKLRARLADESKTAKIVRPINMKNLRRWKQHPSRTDLRGIDTRIRSRRVPLILSDKKMAELRGQGVVRVVNSRGVSQFRDSKTGRFRKVKL